jgi:hypothetical protein
MRAVRVTPVGEIGVRDAFRSAVGRSAEQKPHPLCCEDVHNGLMIVVLARVR